MPSVSELKSELRGLGLSTSGNKAELEARLSAARAPPPATTGSKRAALSPSGRGAKTQVVDLSGDAPASSTGSASASASAAVAGHHRGGGSAAANAGALFDELARGAPTPSELGPDETLRFCEALGVDPEALDALYVSYKLGSTSMGVFPRDAFVASAAKLKWRGVAEVRAALPALRASLAWGRPEFSELYSAFTYKWGCEAGQKVMKKETAVGLWRLLIPEAAFPELPQWLAFVSDVSAGKAVSRDVWASFPRWIAAVHESGGLAHFKLDEADAWPVLIDEFVEHRRKAASSSSPPPPSS